MVSAAGVMLIRGYSDAVNHAFAFAAKHHDRQVRKGTKLPYLTHPANIAVILTRYGCAEDTVVAGILHDVVEDCIRDGYTQEKLKHRIGEKFGDTILQTVLEVTYRRLDDNGVELSLAQRKEDYLDRLSDANNAARWVCVADKLHNVRSILADLQRTLDSPTIWSRFSGGQKATLKWYRDVYERLKLVGFDAPIMEELRVAVEELEKEP